jgi:hypothetical protein
MTSFYHFSNVNRFFREPSDLKLTADLLPCPSNLNIPNIPGDAERVVWLTTEPNPESTWSDAPSVLLRITVDLDRNSRRLRRWLDCVREYGGDAAVIAMTEIVNRDAPGAWGGPEAVWVYFGTIANARHRAVELWGRCE